MLDIIMSLLAIGILMWFVSHSSIFQDKAFPSQVALILLLVKIIYSLSNVYFTDFISMGDGKHYKAEALKYCVSLYRHPEVFIREFITDWGKLPSDLNFLSRNTRFWEQLGLGIHRRILIFLNLISFGQPIAVSIWFGFISFIGQWWILKSFVHYFQKQKYFILGSLFLIPSFEFWSSGINKETYILFSIGLITWQTIQYFKSPNNRSFLFIVIGMIVLFMMRNFVLVSLLPIYIIWIWTVQKKVAQVWKYYLGFVVISALVFILSSQLPPDSPLNIYQQVANRQAEFLSLKEAKTYMPVIPLQNNVSKFPQLILQAYNHIFLRPYLYEVKSTFQLFSWVENFCILIYMIICLSFIKNAPRNNSFFWFIFCFSILNLLFIGITVANIGAISRYKSVYVPLLLACFSTFLSKLKNTFIENK